MKAFIKKSLLGLLIFAWGQSYAQYNTRQIDSLLDPTQQASTLKRITTAYNAAKVIGYQKGIVEGLILFSKNAHAEQQYDKAFNYITQAESASEKITDPILLYDIKTFKGLCYGELGFYKEADQALKSAIPIAKTISDKGDKHYYLSALYTNMAINYGRLGKNKEKSLYDAKGYSESLLLENNSKYVWCAAVTVSNRGFGFIERKQYDSARYYLNKARLLTKKCSDLYMYKKNFAIYVNDLQFGKLCYAEKKLDSSISYYKASANAAALIHYTYGLKKAYAGLAKAYTALNKPKEALLYLQKSNTLGDSLAQTNKAAIKTPLDYIVVNKEKQLMQNKHRYQQVILIIFILLLMVSSAVFLYHRKFKKEVKLSAAKINAMLQKIEANDDKRSPAKIEELKVIVQLAVNNNPAFFMKYNEFDPQFFKSLHNINPSLVATEMEFCTLLRLNFETKEIARYTNISVRAVEAKKYRIRKKLNIPSDQDINIYMNHV